MDVSSTLFSTRAISQYDLTGIALWLGSQLGQFLQDGPAHDSENDRKLGGNNGGPGAIRTRDLCLRRAALYPAELRVHWRPFIVLSGLWPALL